MWTHCEFQRHVTSPWRERREVWREKRKVRIFGKGKCKLIANCANFWQGKCKFIANFSAKMVTSLPSLSLSLSLCISLSLSPKVPHAQYRKRFRASYNRPLQAARLHNEKMALVWSRTAAAGQRWPHMATMMTSTNKWLQRLLDGWAERWPFAGLSTGCERCPQKAANSCCLVSPAVWRCLCFLLSIDQIRNYGPGTRDGASGFDCPAVTVASCSFEAEEFDR